MIPSLHEQLQTIPVEDRANWLKKSHPDIWLELAWSKVNLWRSDQIDQAKILGDTPDFERLLFTLDPRAVDTVNHAFEQYWRDGLIYQDAYLINWSVGLQTALSDVPEDIGREERVDPFVTFQYQAQDFELPVEMQTHTWQSFLKDFLKPTLIWPRLGLGTVRYETIFTDVALAIHPSKFDQYFNFSIFEIQKPGFNQLLATEFLNKVRNHQVEIRYNLSALGVKNIKLILSEKVDPNFGTGIVKVTPGHDLFDYQLYHEFVEKGILEPGQIQTSVGRDGKLTEVCGEFAGLTVDEARPRIIKRLLETSFVQNKE